MYFLPLPGCWWWMMVERRSTLYCRHGNKQEILSHGRKRRPLFLLPRTLLSSILDYLTTGDIAVLDTSVSSYQCRSCFLDCLANLCSKPIVSKTSIAEVTWLSRRHIPISSAVFAGKCSIYSTVKLSFLHSITLRDMDDFAILHLVTNNPGIRSLSIYATGYSPGGEMPSVVTGAGIEFGVAANCRNLEHFSYYFNIDSGETTHPSITTDSWLAMFRRCTQLKTVSLVQETLCDMRDADLNLLCEFGHLFDKLHFHFGKKRYEMTARGIVHFLEACPNLIELGILSKSPPVSIFQCCRKLEKLKLHQCKLSTEHLTAIRNNCKTLRRLSLCSVGSVTTAILELIGCMETLEELKIDRCKLSDAKIATLARSTKLRRLQLSYDSNDLTDDCFMALDDSPIAQSLEQIYLIINADDGNDEEEDGLAGRIAAGFSVFHNLQKIGIRSLFSGSDSKKCALGPEILNLWSAGCPNLQEVDFGPAETVTVEDLGQFATSCRHLSKILLLHLYTNKENCFKTGMKDSEWTGELEFRNEEELPHIFEDYF